MKDKTCDGNETNQETKSWQEQIPGKIMMAPNKFGVKTNEKKTLAETPCQKKRFMVKVKAFDEENPL
ncbi:15283_t:CDS:1, partial [Cetraspora pellucida]